MKKLLLAFVLLAGLASAQQFRTSAVDPHGACTTDVVFNQATGVIWGCLNNVFVPVGSIGTVYNCGTASACVPTNPVKQVKIVFGVTGVLDGMSPAVATVTAMPAFTSSTSYVCTANVNSASASTHVLAISYASATSVVFTAANGSTDTISWICVGT